MNQATENLENDIPETLARSAHSGTSFSPDVRARQEREGYAATLRADFESLAKLASTDEAKALLQLEFTRYRDGYRKRTLALLSSRSRVMSTMIAGPSNFPVRRMEKRNTVVDNRMREIIAFRARALSAIRKTLCPELRPIMSGDADAADRLRKEIGEAEALQARMVATNAAIRKNAKAEPAAQVAALVALGHSEGLAAKLLFKDPCYGQGFPDFRTRNNGANIRRMKARLVEVERNQAVPTTDHDGENARLEDCPAENRVRLFFAGKPDDETRSRLKSCAFRWTPSLGCWQAYRNNRTIQTAKELAA